MTTSVQKNLYGPLWPLGSIPVATTGTPVNIMSLVDPNNYAAPQTATSGTETNTNTPEYTVRAQQIIFMGFKAGASHGLTTNTGNVYIVIKGNGGSNNRDDPGSIIKVLSPGETFFLGSAALNRNVFSPYQIWLDADNAADAAQVTLVIQ